MTDKEKKRERNKKYHAANREKINEGRKKYREGLSDSYVCELVRKEFSAVTQLEKRMSAKELPNEYISKEMIENKRLSVLCKRLIAKKNKANKAK